MRRIPHTIPATRAANVIEDPAARPKPCATSAASPRPSTTSCDPCEEATSGYIHAAAGADGEPVVAHIFRQLMEALELHGRNLFHRDLKTENMLVSREEGGTAQSCRFWPHRFVPRAWDARDPPTSTSSSHTITASSRRGCAGGYDRLVMAAEDGMYRLPSADVWAAGLVLLLLTGVGRMSKIKHNIADALRGRGERFAPLSKDETPIDRLYRLIGPGWQVSPELDQLFRAMVHKDPMMRPSAEEVLACDWMKKADEVTEAEVVAAFESRRPVSEEAHNTMSVTRPGSRTPRPPSTPSSRRFSRWSGRRRGTTFAPRFTSIATGSPRRA